MMQDKRFFKNIISAILFLILVNAGACASDQVENNTVKGNNGPLFQNNGGTVVKNGNTGKYNDLLVNIKNYSTNGGYYQKKYEKLLLAMAGELVEGQDLEISKESIGFYYDKKSARTDRLFLGVDINTVREGSLDYGRFSVKLIKENLNGIVDLVYKYKTILSENEVVGIVIGFKWMENGDSRQVNIWMKKEDLHLFYEGKITQNEMYQRSTITNTTGKIILLPI